MGGVGSAPSVEEVEAVARGIATAVAPPDGLTDVQATLLCAVTRALTDIEIDYSSLEPLDADALARLLAARDEHYRQRIVHHMVLGELVLRPLPEEVAERVATYAAALGIDDDFVRVARRYAQGAFGLAWVDLRRNGFTDRWDERRLGPLRTRTTLEDPFDSPGLDPELAEHWAAFAHLAPGTLGHEVSEMYRQRGFALPGAAGGASPYLAQHDFVHVVADYGTNLEGELEVFALIGRADPDPKGFAWLATVIGLFETGYVHQQGFLQMDVRARNLQGEGMTTRLADAIRRGKAVSEQLGVDLLSVDYHELAALPVDKARAELCMPPKSADAIAAGSPSVRDRLGMSENQRAAADQAGAGERTL